MIYNYLLKMDSILNDRLSEAAMEQTIVWANGEASFKRPWRLDYLGIGKMDRDDIFETANFIISGLPFAINNIYNMKTFISTLMKSFNKATIDNYELIPLSSIATRHIFERHKGRLGESNFMLDIMLGAEKEKYFNYIKEVYFKYNLQEMLHKGVVEKYKDFYEIQEFSSLTPEEIELLKKKEEQYILKAKLIGVTPIPVRLEGRKAIIGKTAVFMCEPEIIIPSYMKVIKNIEIIIDNDAFNGCEQLEKIILVEGITKIGDRAFMDCFELKELIIPESVKEIGEDAFFGCVNLKKL